ncbi:conjugal transfer protein TrbC [Fusobacterium necrogenes]|uniref:Conjugal transfer protein TrbC n=1 Tax=Fusobacterium necrogenes TaxID=858 RepID=A0A377GPR3_9FUSO|nr:TrbC/VirB2 family protein [Fusobacterium necrogenes]STO28762.1 conjugal transfer protein TrbC [Fusobacterium necrogenes]
MKKIIKKNLKIFLLLLAIIAISSSSFASATDLPWEGPLDKLLKSFTGPVARAVSIIAVVACGGMVAFGEAGSAMKRMLNIVFGISIVFAAVTWVPTFFGFTGSALF